MIKKDRPEPVRQGNKESSPARENDDDSLIYKARSRWATLGMLNRLKHSITYPFLENTQNDDERPVHPRLSKVTFQPQKEPKPSKKPISSTPLPMEELETTDLAQFDESQEQFQIADESSELALNDKSDHTPTYESVSKGIRIAILVLFVQQI